MKPEDIARVLSAWSFRDSWGVQAIYVGTASHLIGLLSRGADPELLIELADASPEREDELRRLTGFADEDNLLTEWIDLGGEG